MPSGYAGSQFVLPKPGKGLRAVLIGLLAIWLMFAVGINWGGASSEVFYLFCGNTERILSGEIWRLFTAPLMHVPRGTIGHILMALLGLYFLAPSLEQAFGTARFLKFLLASGVIAYGLQMIVALLLPASSAAKLVPNYWFGAMPVVEAVAIAWALSFKGQTVRLMFVLPVTSRGLIVFVVAISVMYVLAAAETPAGLISPFGGMLCGWLLGGGSPSPLRRFWLKVQLKQLEAEVHRERRQRRQRVRGSGFRVIDGGKERDSDPDDRLLH